MKHFTSFPQIQLNGRFLIWDYRQIVEDKSSILFLRKLLTKEQRNNLLASFPYLEVVEEGDNLNFGEIIAAHFFYPSRKLKIIGVTGSNGKSSTCLYGAELSSLMNKKSAVVGSLGVQILEPGTSKIQTTIETGVTSPDAPLLQQIFVFLIQQNVEHVFMEVSSHALALGRVDGVDFDAGAFLNLTQDHLDFHESMQKYFEAKKMLFSRYLSLSIKKPTYALLNTSDLWVSKLKEESFNGVEMTYAPLNDLIRIQQRGLHGMLAALEGLACEVPLYGDFNVQNVYVAAKLASHINNSTLKHCLSLFKDIKPARGRMEPVSVRGIGLCVVDYAHTPDALEKAISALRHFVPDGGRLITVFGCGGDRDPTKRPIMGGIAEKLSDVVVVTSDNPRTEKPEKVLEDILAGFKAPNDTRIFVIVDRRLAIKKACEIADKKDVILVAGKGHETYQIIGKTKIHFDDVEELLSHA